MKTRCAIIPSASDGNPAGSWRVPADKGITGMKKRDEFNKLIRQCRRGKVDMIIVKSISRLRGELTESGVPTPMGKTVWQPGVIQSILSNEKYKGDALLGKTYIEDCISKKVRVNAGERAQYYVENNHPAIIDSATFGRVQEELARRSGKRKVKQVGTKTEQGKYSGKYALTELLVCGECGTPYRRCTWSTNGKKKIVWWCINRLDYGKKYCHHSPSVEESVLQNAIMNAILRTAKKRADILQTLKLHICKIKCRNFDKHC